MRKGKPKKRILLPDPKFNDTLVTQFINNLMLDGKKSTAYGIFYDALDRMADKAEKEGKPALEMWKKGLENITPGVEVKSRRVGGATFQVPTEIRPSRKVSVAMKNLILFARKRSGKSMAEKLNIPEVNISFFYVFYHLVMLHCILWHSNYVLKFKNVCQKKYCMD